VAVTRRSLSWGDEVGWRRRRKERYSGGTPRKCAYFCICVDVGRRHLQLWQKFGHVRKGFILQDSIVKIKGNLVPEAVKEQSCRFGSCMI
jgi:hypothetical protein